MQENKRCSIFFHLLVPGGKWHTVIERPVRFANRCSSHFHSRTREPLLPPASAVMRRDRSASLAFYEGATAALLTGDTFYPGRLYVRDTAAFAAGTARLVAFTASRPVSAILGTHIDQARTPFTDYPVKTQDQPDEDRLALSRAELVTFDSAVRAMRGRFTRTHLPRFTIWPL